MSTHKSKTIPVKKKKEGTVYSPNPDDTSSIETKEALTQPYTNYNIMLRPISADLMFARWEVDRMAVSSRINPTSMNTLFNGIFPRDSKCKGCLGEGGMPYVKRNSCIGCQLLTRLFVPGEEGHTRSLTIKCGKEEGKKLYISYVRSELDLLNGYTESFRAKEYGTKILSKLDQIASCEKGFPLRIETTRTFCTKSKLSNYIAVSCMLEAEMKTVDMPGIPIFKWIYECKNGYITVENNIAAKGNLTSVLNHSDIMQGPKNARVMRPGVARLILSQVMMNLSFLSHYDFTHGEPSSRSLWFVNTPCTMKYDGIRLESPFTLHILPTAFSSMTLHTTEGLTRVYCSGGFTPQEADVRLVPKINFLSHLRKPSSITPCNPTLSKCMANPLLKEFEAVRIIFYRINDGEFFDHYTNNLGIALFPSSFDAYSFFVALMTQISFQAAVLNNTDLKQIWQDLWKEEEYTAVMLELRALTTFSTTSSVEPTYIMIRDMLCKFYLRCDGLQYIWGALKSLSAIG